MLYITEVYVKNHLVKLMNVQWTHCSSSESICFEITIYNKVKIPSIPSLVAGPSRQFTVHWQPTMLLSSSKETQLFWTHFSRWPWVTDSDPGSCIFCQMVLRVNMPKQWFASQSDCNQCKLGIFSKWCISFGQECMILNRWVFFFNSAVFQVMF